VTVWHTVATGAEYVRVSQDTIRAAVRSGDIPAYPVGKGREFRITAEDIDKWMMSRAWEPKGASA
jgi:excisionase family DNA binding protein